MDIYAIGHIVQWLVFGETHKGTHRKKLIEKFNSKRMQLLDSIVEKCLDNDPNNRYQSIEEIKDEISKYNAQAKRKMISKDKTDKYIDIEEIKDKLVDVLDNICGTDEKNKKFESYNKLNDEDVEKFLENLGRNLNKLQLNWKKCKKENLIIKYGKNH